MASYKNERWASAYVDRPVERVSRSTSPSAQALLMREFERSIERGGDDVAVANFVLSELRKIVRAPSEDQTARTEDPMRLVFRPLDRFLVDNVPSIRPGQIRRTSLGPVWIWLKNEGIPDKLRAFEEF